MTQSPGMEEKISYEPLGVICNISAWNYPWLVGVNVFVTALLAGNTVMYKPSEYAILTGLEIENFLKQASGPMVLFRWHSARECGRNIAGPALRRIFLRSIKPENIFMKNAQGKWFPAS